MNATCPRRNAPFACAALLITILALVAGCSSEPSRVPLTGSVQYGGKPVPTGVVRLIAKDEKGVNSNASIKDGKYEFTAKDGPQVGKYQVQITWPKKTGRKINETEDQEYVQEEVIEQIPSKYNIKSELTLDVTPAMKSFDFDLKK